MTPAAIQSPPQPVSLDSSSARPDRAPIGIFDSGVGGLTVLSAILKQFPAERALYIADQAHVPYGGRPLDEVRAFACGISQFLADSGCRAIIMACNISSAVALESVRKSLSPLPILGMIEAVARRAALESDRIGVLATEGTVKSGAYSAQIRSCRTESTVVEVACPEFVPLVESANLESEEAYNAAIRYLSPLADARCGTVILGCTHYPFLLPVLNQAAQSLEVEMRFIDPAEALLYDLESGMDAACCVHTRFDSRGEPSLLLTTGSLVDFHSQVPRFVPGVRVRTGSARWAAGTLRAATNAEILSPA